jgi:hypothetical protein
MKESLATPSAVASLFFGSCFSEPPPPPGADSAPDRMPPLKPMLKGLLASSLAVVERLEEGASAMHSYAFIGRRGQALHLRLLSHAFRGLLHIVGPGGQRWNRPASPPEAEPPSTSPPLAELRTAAPLPEADPSSGGAEALEPIILPEDGVYEVLVTSIDNLCYRAAVSDGDYSLEALSHAS